MKRSLLKLLLLRQRWCQQTRSFSLFGRNINDFGLEKPPYSVINPLLASKNDATLTELINELSKKGTKIPSYVHGENENPPPDTITYNAEDVSRIRAAAKLAAHCVRIAPDILRPGTTTNQLNDELHKEIVSKGGYPSVLGYKNFPKAVSTSVNNVACHGIPDDRPVEPGDLVSLDVTVFKDGFHGVCGSTILVESSKCDPIARYLRSVAEECLFRGISACRPGCLLIDIGAGIGKFARQRYIKVIPPLTGHGIGQYFHSSPDVYHVMNNYPGTMTPGTHTTS